MAGASAAIYSARKGLRVAIVAEKVGGQGKGNRRNREPDFRAADYRCTVGRQFKKPYQSLSHRLV